MESRIPAGEETAKKFKEIANKAVELIAELQVMDIETQKLLESEAERLGIKDVVEAYDFTSNEYPTPPGSNQPSSWRPINRPGIYSYDIHIKSVK